MMVRDSVWLMAWSSADVGRQAAVLLEALADAVEHDDGVVQRVADDREDGRDHRRDRTCVCVSENNAEHEDRVVHHREDGAERQPPGVEAERDVDARSATA